MYIASTKFVLQKCLFPAYLHFNAPGCENAYLTNQKFNEKEIGVNPSLICRTTDRPYSKKKFVTELISYSYIYWF